MASLSEEDFSCPVCREFFKDPVLLPCSHSFCKTCVRQFWKAAKTRKCPLCLAVSRRNPPLNRALKNLCESFVKERNKRRLSESEQNCGLHGKKLTLFCLEDEELACSVCRDSEKHISHAFRPVSKAAPLCKEKLKNKLYSLRLKWGRNGRIKTEFEEMVQHIKVQAEKTERQIKHQFEKLHQFLRDEEEATITALREEEEQKKQLMKEKLDEIDARISAISLTIKDTEELLNDSNVCFLKKFPGSMERTQISPPDPQTPSGALIHVSRYLGNLPFRVWEKMRDIVSYTPVILDPNTAHMFLPLSEDLTSASHDLWKYQRVPDNPERFDQHVYVLGSEGFTSGSHCWEVEVKRSSAWFFGVTTASNERKGWSPVNAGIWSVKYNVSDFSNVIRCTSPIAHNEFFVNRSLERVRVDLDCDRGTVSFSDPLTHTHIHTFTTTFADTVFPLFHCSMFGSLRVLPISGQQMLHL